MKQINFDLLVGQVAKLYACNDANCFQLGSVIFEVREDENDGYRSAMQDVVIVEQASDNNYFLDDVIIVSTNDGYALDSLNNYHRWLEFGTDYSDSYYPCFVFRFMPMQSPINIVDEQTRDIIGLINK